MNMPLAKQSTHRRLLAFAEPSQIVGCHHVVAHERLRAWTSWLRMARFAHWLLSRTMLSIWVNKHPLLCTVIEMGTGHSQPERLFALCMFCSQSRYSDHARYAVTPTRGHRHF